MNISTLGLRFSQLRPESQNRASGDSNYNV